MNKKYKELSGNTIIFAIGTFGAKVIMFFMVPLYTNILTASEYGTADLIQTISSLFVPIFSIMIQDAVLRFGLSENINKRSVLKNALFINLIGMLIAIILVPILTYYKPVEDWTVYLYCILITNMLSNVLFSYVKAINKNKLFSLCGILSTFILAGLNVIFLLFFKLGIKGYLLSIIISQLFSCLFLAININLYKDLKNISINRCLMKEMILYSLPLIANNLSWWILNSSDKLMVEHYCGSSDLGLYTAASKIPALISIINTIFLQAWTISSIKDYEKEKDKKFFKNIFRFYSLAMMITTSFILLIIKNLMNVYVGVDYRASWRYVPLLLFGTVFYGFSLFFGTIYSAAKKNMNIAISTAAAALINIFINLILLGRIGVIAATISTAISYFAVGVYRMIDSRRFLRFDINLNFFIVNTILLLCQTIVITLDFHNVLCSVITIFLLIIINYNFILDLCHLFIANIKKYINVKREG